MNKTAIELISYERVRQISQEGWTPEHDDEHDDGELAHAAAAYAVEATGYMPHPDAILNGMGPTKPLWPWGPEWWKPADDPIRNLVKAGALIVAEIERLQRQKTPPLDGKDAEIACVPMDHVIDRTAGQGVQLAQAEGWIRQLMASYQSIQQTCANKDAALSALRSELATRNEIIEEAKRALADVVDQDDRELGYDRLVHQVTMERAKSALARAEAMKGDR